ncbi:Uncharacterised protein [Bordetella pertussis]|nr:Uncharacterised protein [Bordetella pertussis]CFO08070.1 Uncharacterised protein [Bordetella pertussis]CFO73865.1 Uncharacterised protein [Bordetella pertussis]CFU83128.1 Uncharacterised protein [Bordetella pertussis]CPI10361.1 Uncharacterised protein [Bordetella pertussis]
MKTSLCSHRVAPPKITMTDRFIQCMPSMALPVRRSQSIWAMDAVIATAVAA